MARIFTTLGRKAPVADGNNDHQHTGERHVRVKSAVVRVRVRVGCETFKAKILWVILGMDDLTQPPVLHSVGEYV